MALLWGMPALEGGESDLEKSSPKLKGRSLCVVSPLEFREACFSVPAIRALSHFCPDTSISMLCPASQLAMWKRVVPAIDHIINYRISDSAGQIGSRLDTSELEFDSAIIWEECKAAKAISKAGVAQRLGYPAGDLEKRLTDKINVVGAAGPIEHRVRYYLNFMAQLGADAFVRSSFEVAPLPSPPEKLKIAITPFSEYGSAYQWPMDRFIEVMDALRERFGTVCWTILEPMAGAVSAAKLDQFKTMLDEHNMSAEYHRGAEDLFDQLAKSSVLLACDGEIAHMAAHIGLPAAVIFGPNAPEWKRPLGKQSVVVRDHVVCSPCFLEKCPLDRRCMNQITVDMVIDGFEQALRLRQE